MIFNNGRYYVGIKLNPTEYEVLSDVASVMYAIYSDGSIFQEDDLPYFQGRVMVFLNNEGVALDIINRLRSIANHIINTTPGDNPTEENVIYACQTLETKLYEQYPGLRMRVIKGC